MFSAVCIFCLPFHSFAVALVCAGQNLHTLGINIIFVCFSLPLPLSLSFTLTPHPVYFFWTVSPLSNAMLLFSLCLHANVGRTPFLWLPFFILSSVVFILLRRRRRRRHHLRHRPEKCLCPFVRMLPPRTYGTPIGANVNVWTHFRAIDHHIIPYSYTHIVLIFIFYLFYRKFSCGKKKKINNF